MNNLIPIEFKGQRILTTKQLAEGYETDSQVITNNFNRNKERYIQEKHYFALEDEDKRDFLNLTQIDLGSLKNTKTLYLWTEKGAMLHAKSLGTDKAWEVYDILVETYFRVKEQQKPTCIEDLIIMQATALKDLREQTTMAINTANETKQEVQAIRDVVALSSTQWRKDTSVLINKIALIIGGYEHIKHIREESYKLLNERMGVDVQTRITNKRRRMADEGVCKSRRDKLTVLDVIADDKKLIEGYVAIVKEMAIKYKVA